MSDHVYRAYNLLIAVDFALPSLATAELIGGSTDPADVTIRTGPVVMPPDPQDMEELKVAVAGPDVFVEIIETGRFLITGGHTIVVDPEPGVEEAEVSLFLLGTVFGVVLYQRGLVPLHGNAIVHEGRAFLFCGDSGAGKSTLATYFRDRGYGVLTDDVCPVRFDGAQLTALPGLARIKLWRDSLELLGYATAGLRQLPWKVEKYELGLEQIESMDTLPIGAIYHLRDTRDGRPSGVHRLTGLDAANAVSANIYRRRVADIMGLAPLYLNIMMLIVQKVPVFAANRQWGLERFASEAAAIEDHLQAVTARIAPPTL